MTPLRSIREVVKTLARSSRNLAKESYTAAKAYRRNKTASTTGRLRLKRFMERFLCVRADDASSCPPASIRVPAPEDDHKGLLARTANVCLDWIKRKARFRCFRAEDDELVARFFPVIDSIDFEGLPGYVSSIRHLQSLKEVDETIPFECEIRMTPMFGSYHVLFPVIFSDGVQWLIKVPAAGCVGSWDSSAARSLRSEASTMKFLNDKTSIPVPKVYGFNSNLDNPVGCPFILMEHLDGRPLYEKWYNGFDSSEAQEQFRERALESLAVAMVQLNTLDFAQAGAPSFDESETLQAIKPVRVFDAPAMHVKMISDSPGEGRIFCDVGPHDNTRAYFLSMLDKQWRHPEDRSGKGLNKVLRLFIDWISNDQRAGGNDFILTHPDFNMQNVLVAEDGTLQGLIDWDGVSTVPRSVGCPFPKWLTFDWDPANYNYDVDEEDRCCDAQHHSPSAMKHYRALYAHFIQKAASEHEAKLKVSTAELVNVLRKSLLIESLDRAAKDPLSTSHIMIAIIEKIAHITSQRSFKINNAPYNDFTKRGDFSNSVKSSKETRTVSDASSGHKCSGQSTVSLVVSQSTAPTDTSAEEDRRHLIARGISETQSSSVQDFRNIESRMFNDERCQKDAANKKRRTQSLPKRAPHFMRTNLHPFSGSKCQQRGPIAFSVPANVTGPNKANPPPAASTSPSSMNSLDQVHPSYGRSHNHGIQQRSVDGAPVAGCIDSASQPDATSDDDTRTGQLEHSQPNSSALKQQHCLTMRSAEDETYNSTQSKAESQSDADLERKHGEGDGGTLACDRPFTTQAPQKGSIRRRLKAKLASYHGSFLNKPQVTSRSSIEDMESVNKGPIRTSSRRKRIVTWIRKTSHKCSEGAENHDPASALDAVLPEIPRVSHFNIPNQSILDSATSMDVADFGDSISKPMDIDSNPIAEVIQDLSSQNVEEPVDDAKLFQERFLTAQICYDIVDGTLDEARMQRLKMGFTALLDSL